MVEPWYRWEGTDLIVELRVQPRARKDEFGSVQDGRRRLRVTAPPLGGRANSHIRKVLATSFGVRQQQVKIESGATGRDKRFRIETPSTLPPGLEIEY